MGNVGPKGTSASTTGFRAGSTRLTVLDVESIFSGEFAFSANLWVSIHLLRK
jgi:hypothetical protein